MTRLPLPALDGRTPLGFLAALGVLRLLTERCATPAKLGWSTVDCTAVVTGTRGGIDELVDDLTAVVRSIPPDGVLPGLPTDLPPPGEAPDRLRLPRLKLAEYAGTVWQDAGADGERWMASLVTDLSLDDQGRADISLYTAPSGKQSMRTMLEKPLRIVQKHPEVLREALVSWRRHAGVSGEYLDHRVLYAAADAPDGTSRERGVPGATWLALMAYPLLRTTVTDGKPVTTGWQYPTGRERDRRLTYPLWSTPVGTDTVIALLDHPVLTGADPGVPPAAARALSVFLVCAAARRRIPGRTFAGALAPIPPATPTPGRRRRTPNTAGTAAGPWR